MADFSSFVTAARAAVKADTSSADLTQIAAAQPALRPLVAANPSADAALLDWLEAQDDTFVKAAVAARHSKDAGETFGASAPVRRASWVVPVIVAVALVAAAAGVGIGHWAWPPKDTSPMSGVLAAPQVVPPDGNSTDFTKSAWIQVPGTPKPDALIVDVQFDYQCPYCGKLEQGYDQAFADLAASGDIILRYHLRTFLDRFGGNSSSTMAGIAAACADVVDNTKYAAYHNTIFANQPATEGTGYTDQQLRSDFATAAGFTGDALTTFQACYDRRATRDWVAYSEPNNAGLVQNPNPPNTYLFGGNAPLYYDPSTGQMTNDTTNGTAAGVQGTPMLLVNGNVISWGGLFDANGNPAIAQTADSLLTYLQQSAGM
ncbi:MAG: DsbA family protein [Propionibacteriaceae bacterium]|nr:DsbA family protein [Propionibacteriaceae bacterium]